MSIVLKGRMLIYEDALLNNYGIRVENNRIAQIAPNKDLVCEEGDEIYELSDQIILPGFVNGHHHMYGTLSHGITADVMVSDFNNFLTDFWWKYVEDRVDHDLVRTTAKWACVEMIESGITSFMDILEGPGSIPGALQIEKEEIKKAGLRGFLSFEACQRVSAGNGLSGIRENMDFVKLCSKDDLIKGLPSIHTLFTCDKEFVKRAKEEADRYHCMLHMHLSESDYEPSWSLVHYGKRPVEVYEEWGILDQNILASQVVAVTDEELDLLAKHHVSVISMPLSNCEVGGGIAPVSKMLERGMTVGLGTDGYINNFFEICRGAFLIHKANEKNSQVMPAKTVYKLATSGGAKAMGIDAGELAVGKLADIIAVKIDTPTPINEHNVFEQLILFRNPADVKYVMVNGKLLKKDGKLITVEKEKCRMEMAEAAEKFWNNYDAGGEYI